MVAALADQVVDRDAERLAPVAAALVCGGERDVEPGVPVVRLVLLAHVQDAGDLAVELDHERLDLRVLEHLPPGAVRVIPSPPPRHRRLLEDRDERPQVGLGDVSQAKALAAELVIGHRS